MTIKEARKLLRPPLIFGNPKQINAADLVSLFERASTCLRVESYQRECISCGDIHTDECKVCKGEGALPVSKEWLESLDEDGLAKIIDELRELGFAV